MMNIVIAWITAFMVTNAPIYNAQHYFPDARETPTEAQARYESIARDIAEIAYDPAEEPLFKGPNGRARTVSVIEGIMLYESGRFRKDVDFGIGPKSKGAGAAVCNMQIMVGSGRTGRYNMTKQRFAWTNDPSTDTFLPGYTMRELLTDRKVCIRTGLHMIRQSFHTCGDQMPPDQKLRFYATGSCKLGRVDSYIRMSTAMQWFEEHPAPFTDTEAYLILHPDAAFTEAPSFSDVLLSSTASSR